MEQQIPKYKLMTVYIISEVVFIPMFLLSLYLLVKLYK